MTGNAKTGGARDGWKKGVGPYSKSYPKMTHVSDYGNRGIDARQFESGQKKPGSWSKIDEALNDVTWQPGGIKQGNSPPRYRAKSPSNTKSPSAASPTGK